MCPYKSENMRIYPYCQDRLVCRPDACCVPGSGPRGSGTNARTANVAGMEPDKYQVRLGAVQQTLFIPLAARADDVTSEVDMPGRR
jgi:hypothetical protein